MKPILFLILIAAFFAGTANAIGNDEKWFEESQANETGSTYSSNYDFAVYAENRLDQSRNFVERLKNVKADQPQQTVNYEYFDYKTAAILSKIQETQENLDRYKTADSSGAVFYRGKVIDNLNELSRLEQK